MSAEAGNQKEKKSYSLMPHFITAVIVIVICVFSQTTPLELLGGIGNMFVVGSAKGKVRREFPNDRLQFNYTLVGKKGAVCGEMEVVADRFGRKNRPQRFVVDGQVYLEPANPLEGTIDAVRGLSLRGSFRKRWDVNCTP